MVKLALEKLKAFYLAMRQVMQSTESYPQPMVDFQATLQNVITSHESDALTNLSITGCQQLNEAFFQMVSRYPSDIKAKNASLLAPYYHFLCENHIFGMHHGITIRVNENFLDFIDSISPDNIPFSDDIPITVCVKPPLDSDSILKILSKLPHPIIYQFAPSDVTPTFSQNLQGHDYILSPLSHVKTWIGNAASLENYIRQRQPLSAAKISQACIMNLNGCLKQYKHFSVADIENLLDSGVKLSDLNVQMIRKLKADYRQKISTTNDIQILRMIFQRFSGFFPNVKRKKRFNLSEPVDAAMFLAAPRRFRITSTELFAAIEAQSANPVDVPNRTRWSVDVAISELTLFQRVAARCRGQVRIQGLALLTWMMKNIDPLPNKLTILIDDSFIDKDVSHITCESDREIAFFLKHGGCLPRTTLPEALDLSLLDCRNIPVTKENIALCIEYGATWGAFRLDDLQDVSGIRCQHFAQLEEAKALQLDITKIDMSAVVIENAAQLQQLIDWGVPLSQLQNFTLGFTPTLAQLTQLGLYRFTVRGIEQLLKSYVIAREDILPTTHDDLPTRIPIYQFNNEEMYLLYRWLHTCIESNLLHPKLHKHIIQLCTNLEIRQAELNIRETLRAFTDEIKGGHGLSFRTDFVASKFKLFVSKNTQDLAKIFPARLALALESLLHQPIINEASLTPVMHLLAAYHQHASHMENPYATYAFRIFIQCLWVFTRLGFNCQAFTPDAFNNIGAELLMLGQIDIQKLILISYYDTTTREQVTLATTLDETLRDLEKHEKFAHPETREALPISVAHCLCRTYPEIQQRLQQLDQQWKTGNKLIIAAAKLKQDTLYMLDQLHQLGDKLYNNSSERQHGQYSEATAYNDIKAFHLELAKYPEVAQLFNRTSIKLNTRGGNATNLSQLFTQSKHDGCTNYLGQSIKEWVEKFRLNFNAEIPQSPFTDLMNASQAPSSNAHTTIETYRLSNRLAQCVPENHSLAQATVFAEKHGNSNMSSLGR